MGKKAGSLHYTDQLHREGSLYHLSCSHSGSWHKKLKKTSHEPPREQNITTFNQQEMIQLICKTAFHTSFSSDLMQCQIWIFWRMEKLPQEVRDSLDWISLELHLQTTPPLKEAQASQHVVPTMRANEIYQLKSWVNWKVFGCCIIK